MWRNWKHWTTCLFLTNDTVKRDFSTDWSTETLKLMSKVRPRPSQNPLGLSVGSLRPDAYVRATSAPTLPAVLATPIALCASPSPSAARGEEAQDRDFRWCPVAPPRSTSMLLRFIERRRCFWHKNDLATVPLRPQRGKRGAEKSPKDFSRGRIRVL